MTPSNTLPRFAAIDIGTNSVLLLVADRHPDGRFTAVEEHAEITRLGRGVDATRTLAREAIDETLGVVAGFVARARQLGAADVAISATSAARDASNGPQFIEEARARTGVTPAIISGPEEARLSFASAFADFGAGAPLLMIDIGGGSTEFVYGTADGAVGWRHSFDVGSVRLSERHVRHDPPSPDELAAVRAALGAAFGALPPPPPGARLVGIAGTVTTIFAVAHQLTPYDPNRVHGARLELAEVHQTVAVLSGLPLEQRRQLPGLQPKRAEVIVAGGLVLAAAMEALGVTSLTVSDRGLRWGLLADRFGGAAR